MEDELAHCPAPLWSSVLGLYQEVPEWLGLMWFLFKRQIGVFKGF